MLSDKFSKLDTISHLQNIYAKIQISAVGLYLLCKIRIVFVFDDVCGARIGGKSSRDINSSIEAAEKRAVRSNSGTECTL